MITPFNVFMIGVVALLALETIVYWHRASKGNWKLWPAGRSMMVMLAIIGVAFAFGVVNNTIGPYEARPYVGTFLYSLFIAALILIRITIRKEMLIGKAIDREEAGPVTGPVVVTVTGPVTVNVAEAPHE